MTGRVEMLRRIFEEIEKKRKKLSHRNGKTSFLVYNLKFFKNYAFWVLWLQFYFFCNFLKNAPEYIYPSGNFVFVKFCVGQASITIF